jgi:hypothetical protein
MDWVDGIKTRQESQLATTGDQVRNEDLREGRWRQ